MITGLRIAGVKIALYINTIDIRESVQMVDGRRNIFCFSVLIFRLGFGIDAYITFSSISTLGSQHIQK